MPLSYERLLRVEIVKRDFKKRAYLGATRRPCLSEGMLMYKVMCLSVRAAKVGTLFKRYYY
jgi:hypothetical protein